MVTILEHFHVVLRSITSRIRAEQFKRRVLACLRSWDQMSVFHFNLVDKLREVFIGKTHEELEKQKAFETVAALITSEETSDPEGVDGIPLFDDQPIDFSKVACSIDGVPMEDDNLDGEPLPAHGLDGVPMTEEDIDGVPMESGDVVQSNIVEKSTVTSKWELVDYGDDSDDSESSSGQQSTQREVSAVTKKKQQLIAEVDEKKRRMLREVELKVVELTDALESSGSYSKAEISERVSKFRDKLMQEAVEPKSSPPRKAYSTRGKSRSPSPSTIAKYSLEESTQVKESKTHSPGEKSSRKQSQTKSPARKYSTDDSNLHSHEPSTKRMRSRSPVKRSRSRSYSPKRKSPSRKRSRSRSSSPHRNTHSSRHKSPKSRRHRSRSRSPKRSKKRSRSRSPHKSKSSNKKKHSH